MTNNKSISFYGAQCWTVFVTVLAVVLFASVPAFAEGAVGIAQNYQLGMQEPATDSAQRIHDFHNLLLYIITAITIFVLVLLLYVIVRFNAKANPTPSNTTHNVMLEVIWTVIPVVILIVIAVPSFKILYANDRIQDPEMTLKVIGYQWYWGYEYPDHGDVSFSAYMLQEDDIDKEQGQNFLLSTDNIVVLPAQTNIQVLISAGLNDVIHSWAVPAFGIKTDAVPGRTNETGFKINRTGVFYGQCSELCGKDHSYMPIEIWSVEKSVFDEWAQRAQDDLDAANAWIRDNHNPALETAENQ